MDNSELKYLALGDSYTIGESVAENERWPIQLSDSLGTNGILISETRIIAKTGWTTDELNAGIDTNRPEINYDLVSLLIGVNNQYRGRDSEEFRSQFKLLLNRAVCFSGGRKERIIVLSIPDWGVTPFASGRDNLKISSEIDLFNSIIKEESGIAGITFFNITDISRNAADDNTLLAGDGLHPSGKMYSKWVSIILPYVISILSKEEDSDG